jgi:hypothetical protein
MAAVSVPLLLLLQQLLYRLMSQPAGYVSPDQLHALCSCIRLRGLPRSYLNTVLPQLDWYNSATEPGMHVGWTTGAVEGLSCVAQHHKDLAQLGFHMQDWQQ